ASQVVLRDYNESPTGTGARTERMHVTGLDDVNAAGTWTLRVVDQVGSDSGTLQDFELTVHTDVGGQPPIPTSASYDSQVLDLGGGVSAWTSMSWGARAMAGSTIQLRTRAAADADALAAAAWSTPMVDPGGTVPPIPAARFFQYRIELTSDGDAAPSVDWVRLDYATGE
ncbi:MAG TPA: proprotein convertase P-domain-containing protein, partial [Kofleriaceae bacterium]|nr:proprotein convertase P-domain-containing protein [Kofleriaceae bacterium]